MAARRRTVSRTPFGPKAGQCAGLVVLGRAGLIVPLRFRFPCFFCFFWSLSMSMNGFGSVGPPPVGSGRSAGFLFGAGLISGLVSLAGAQPAPDRKPDAPAAAAPAAQNEPAPANTAMPKEEGPTLKVGSKAPGFKVAKWIKGDEIKEFVAGRVYVVEFWATWCGPCKKSIPHLTDVAAKMKDSVTVVGVSVWETPPEDTTTEYLPKVEEFVAKMGDKMNYVVAADTAEHDMADTWMAASGQQGIPASFIVKDGIVQWIGHPLDGLDAALAEIVAGTYDPSKEAERKAKAEEAMRGKQEIFQKVTELANTDKRAAAVELDKLITLEEEKEGKKFLNRFKFDLMLGFDEAAAYGFGKELAAGILKDDGFNQYVMAERILTDDALKAPDFPFALALAERAAATWEGDNAPVLDVVGYAYYKLGNVGKAIEVQEGVLKAIEANTDADPNFLTHAKENMDLYRKAKEGQAPGK